MSPEDVQIERDKNFIIRDGANKRVIVAYRARLATPDGVKIQTVYVDPSLIDDTNP